MAAFNSDARAKSTMYSSIDSVHSVFYRSLSSSLRVAPIIAFGELTKVSKKG